MMNVKVKVYNESKYNKESKKVAEVEYLNIKGYEVRKIEDNEIFEMGFDETDDFQEYLIITLENGETATFRNSLVDMFRI